jgi:hypothetical protein
LEGESLDFKAKSYDLADEAKKISFIKDTICMANTPREESA